MFMYVYIFIKQIRGDVVDAVPLGTLEQEIYVHQKQHVLVRSTNTQEENPQ
jgi:hypothetical protein